MLPWMRPKIKVRMGTLRVGKKITTPFVPMIVPELEKVGTVIVVRNLSLWSKFKQWLKKVWEYVRY